MVPLIKKITAIDLRGFVPLDEPAGYARRRFDDLFTRQRFNGKKRIIRPRNLGSAFGRKPWQDRQKRSPWQPGGSLHPDGRQRRGDEAGHSRQHGLRPGTLRPVATRNDHYLAVAYTVRDRLLAQWAKTAHTYYEKGEPDRLLPLGGVSARPQLENHMINLGLYDDVRKAVEALGLDFRALIDQEAEPGLGNGGLGRLAACYLDSLATLNIPAIGYGIRTNSGFSRKRSATGGSRRSRISGCAWGTPGRWRVRRSPTTSRSAAIPKSVPDDNGPLTVRWIPERRIPRRGLRHDDHRLRLPVGHHAAPLQG